MNILDFMLGLALLAVVPFALAAYGGHVAADALPPSTRRNVKLKFWGLFIIGVAIAALSQYRTMRQDAVREGKTEEAKKQYMSAADEFKNATTTVLSQLNLSGKDKPRIVNKRPIAKPAQTPIRVQPTEEGSAIKGKALDLADDMTQWAKRRNDTFEFLRPADPERADLFLKNTNTVFQGYFGQRLNESVLELKERGAYVGDVQIYCSQVILLSIPDCAGQLKRAANQLGR